VLRDETARIRRATSHDAEQIAALVAEHAEYERGEARPEPQALAQALQGSPARIVAWIVEQAGEPLGYAAVTEDFSTWRARPFLHLDCLFVRAQYRGRGIGADLFREAQRHAREQGLVTLEWQTPHWNGDAIRFYERMGGRYAVKARFTLDGLELEL
jgi:GNAT superfamily N-acetyltransferase